RALQTVGAPALEMPAASATLTPPAVFTPLAERSHRPSLASVPPLEEPAPPPPPIAMADRRSATPETSDDGHEDTAIADDQAEAVDADDPNTHSGPIAAQSDAMGDLAASRGPEPFAHLAPPPDEPQLGVDRPASRNARRRSWETP